MGSINAITNWSGALYVSNDTAQGLGSGGGCQRYGTINVNASRSSASYGRDNATEIRPTNYAIQYFIKC